MHVPLCDVRLIGEVAFDCLTGSRTGKVLASLSQAIYLLGKQDELLWLAPDTSPMHHRCMRVSAPLPRMQVGASFQVREGLLVTETGRVLNFGSSPIWKPPVFPYAGITPTGWLGGFVQSAFRQLTTQKKPSGWGVLIPAILEMAAGQAPPGQVADGIILPGNVWPAVKGILLACLAHDFVSIMPPAAVLVGLGAGLTPSGDDFLGGLFFSITLLRRAYPEILHLQAWNYADFILRCKSQTNLISFTLLKDHAEGHALEPLHLFANALLAGQPVDQSLHWAEELTAVGHSTGWDLLTGFLVGMSVTFSQ